MWGGVVKKGDVLKEEPESANRVVRQLYEQERDKRKEKARENHDEQSRQPKTSMAMPAFLRGDKSELEKYLEEFNMHPKVLFECNEVKERVQQEIPGVLREVPDYPGCLGRIGEAQGGLEMG